MAVTLRDVARRCGLSPSTVSDVLNNRTRTWASEETRRRVFEAASTLGYRPHSAARALRTGKTYVVAFLYHRNWTELPVTWDGAAEIMAARLGEHGYELRLHVYPNQSHLMEGLDDMVRRKSCDAIVLFGPELDVAEQGQFLERNEMPFVVKGRHEREYPHWLQVDYDHEGMMDSVVSHFVSHGHRNLAYIGYSLNEVYQHRLYNGFREAVWRHCGAYPPDDVLVHVHNTPEAILVPLLERWISLPESDRPTALAIGAGEHEWRLIERTLALNGRTIGYGPGQIAVAGHAYYGANLTFAEGMFFSDISHLGIGEVVVEDLLLPLLNGKTIEKPIRRILPGLKPIRSLRLVLPGPLKSMPTPLEG